MNTLFQRMAVVVLGLSCLISSAFAQNFPNKPIQIIVPVAAGGIPDASYFYFVHSFYARPKNSAHSAAQTDYGSLFTCAVARDNLFATQFHPEKSAAHGLALFRNFLHWNP